jgi:hypothetical protein
LIGCFQTGCDVPPRRDYNGNDRSATKRNLKRMRDSQAFRLDRYCRLNGKREL